MLGYTRYSAGDMVRDMVRQQKITLEVFNQRAEANHEIDQMIDEKLRELRETADIVIDSRLGFYWIPESFKVYLDLSLDVATERIMKDAETNQERATEINAVDTIADARRAVERRQTTEAKRFTTLYGVDPYREENFDLVINTSGQTPQTVALSVFEHYQKWLQSETWQTVRQGMNP